jgi:hypothetical protein
MDFLKTEPKHLKLVPDKVLSDDEQNMTSPSIFELAYQLQTQQTNSILINEHTPIVFDFNNQ